MWAWLPILALVSGIIGEVLQLIKILRKKHYSGVSRSKYVIAIGMSVLFTSYFIAIGESGIAITYGVYALIKFYIIIQCLIFKRKKRLEKWKKRV